MVKEEALIALRNKILAKANSMLTNHVTVLNFDASQAG